MNHPNSANLKDTILSTCQEILSEDPNLFWPNQLKILSWKSKKITGALITKVNGQRYLGLIRKDIKGQDYWKYKPLWETTSETPEESNLNQPNSSVPNQLDNIAKFQQRQSLAETLKNKVEEQRQAQTKNYENNANASEK